MHVPWVRVRVRPEIFCRTRVRVRVGCHLVTPAGGLTRDLFAVAKAGRWCGAWWGQEAFLLSAAAVVVKKLELYL